MVLCFGPPAIVGQIGVPARLMAPHPAEQLGGEKSAGLAKGEGTYRRGLLIFGDS